MELNRWCITGKNLTLEEQKIINAYIRSIPGGEHYTDEDNYISRNFVYVSYGKYFTSQMSYVYTNFTLLKFEEFKKYVLKEECTTSDILVTCL